MTEAPRHFGDRVPEADYFASLNPALVQEVPPSARRILHVGCADGRLGERYKLARPDREVFGVEHNAELLPLAQAALDEVFDCDVTREAPPLPPGSLDCIVLENVLERVYDPVRVVTLLKPLLQPDGFFLVSIPNIQHHQVLSSILSGDFQLHADGLPSRDHMRFYAAANIQKLFLDAGCLPERAGSMTTPCPPALKGAFAAVGRALGLDTDLLGAKLEAEQYVFRARPLPDVPASTRGITFVVPVNNSRQLADNLMASPIFRSGRHEVVRVTGAGNAAQALAACMQRAAERNDIVVQIHQDVYLPEGWDDRLIAGLAAAEAIHGPVGVAGVFGVVAGPYGGFERAGRVVDRLTLLATPHALPAAAVSLDELLLVFPRPNGEVPKLNEELGFHFYGSDACLAARAAGKAVVIVDAPCLHNSKSSYVLDESFYRSAAIFSGRWKAELPYATTCVQIDAAGNTRVW